MINDGEHRFRASWTKTLETLYVPQTALTECPMAHLYLRHQQHVLPSIPDLGLQDTFRREQIAIDHLEELFLDVRNILHHYHIFLSTLPSAIVNFRFPGTWNVDECLRTRKFDHMKINIYDDSSATTDNKLKIRRARWRVLDAQLHINGRCPILHL